MRRYIAKMGAKKKEKSEEVSQFAKTDMERVGLFKETGYVSIGDPYKAVKSTYTLVMRLLRNSQLEFSSIH